MSFDDPVQRALDALRAEDRSLQARPHVEKAVLDAFGRRRTRTAPLAVITPLAATAVVVLAATMALHDSRLQAPALPSLPETPRSFWRSQPMPARATPPIAMESRRATPEPELPVVGHDTFTQTVWVSVPRAYLPLLGMPVIEPDAAGMVDIEVVLGADGVSRAIHLLPPDLR